MKNYTSLRKMKASEVAPSFTEEKVTAETFAEEVAKGTLYKGFEPPKDATMLKFRYYSPDGTLIEQNNVPVVYDGTGIESVVTYYQLSNSSDKDKLDKNGWTDKVQTVTAEKRFLWSYIKTTYTNNAFSCTEPCITAVFGEQGERGAMYLGHYANNQDAYTKNHPALFTGDYYLDTTDSYLYEYNKESNIWTPIDDLTDYRYNQSINDIFEAIESSTDREKFLKAKIAWVQNLSAAIARVQTLLANEIQLTSGKDLNEKTTGGIIHSANYDGTIKDGKITESGKNGWAIDYDGKAEFNNVTVRGTVDGSVVKGSTISGGSITIGDKFSVDEDGIIDVKGGCFNINNKFIVDKDGIIDVKGGCFNINNKFIVDKDGIIDVKGGCFNINNKFIVDKDGIIDVKGGCFNINNKFIVDKDGIIDVKGGCFNINNKFIVDKDGNLNAKAGSFSGLLKQGCNFYIATRLTVTYNGTEWTCKTSNALYKDFYRAAKGIFMLHLPAEDISKGLPRVITHYCGDKRMSNGQAPTIENVINNTYYPGGSNPAYQINCRSGLNVSAGDYNFDWLPLYFTDNNNDGFTDPIYAILTLIYI